MEPLVLDNRRPAGLVTGAQLVAAPENVLAVCERASKLLRSPEGPCRVSAICIKRPSGHVNTHVRLDPPSGARISASLGATDDDTVKAAIIALLKAAKIHAEIAL